MNEIDFSRRNVKRVQEILIERAEAEKERPLSLKEKDLFNLKYMRYSIGLGSLWCRLGCISTLDRAIRKQEKDMGIRKRKAARGKGKPREEPPEYQQMSFGTDGCELQEIREKDDENFN